MASSMDRSRARCFRQTRLLVRAREALRLADACFSDTPCPHLPAPPLQPFFLSLQHAGPIADSGPLHVLRPLQPSQSTRHCLLTPLMLGQRRVPGEVRALSELGQNRAQRPSRAGGGDLGESVPKSLLQSRPFWIASGSYASGAGGWEPNKRGVN